MVSKPFIRDGVGYIPLNASSTGRRGRPRPEDTYTKAWALVDPEVFEEAAAVSWHLTDTGYAARWYGGRPPKRKRERLHRFVLGMVHGETRQVDHRNRNKLDCRRANLRITTEAQNRQNVPSNRNVTSKYRGVCWDKERDCWKAQARLGSEYLQKRFPGTPAGEQEAAEYARDWRAQHMTHAMD